MEIVKQVAKDSNASNEFNASADDTNTDVVNILSPFSAPLDLLPTATSARDGYGEIALTSKKEIKLFSAVVTPELSQDVQEELPKYLLKTLLSKDIFPQKKIKAE